MKVKIIFMRSQQSTLNLSTLSKIYFRLNFENNDSITDCFEDSVKYNKYVWIIEKEGIIILKFLKIIHFYLKNSFFKL